MILTFLINISYISLFTSIIFSIYEIILHIKKKNLNTILEVLFSFVFLFCGSFIGIFLLLTFGILYLPFYIYGYNLF